MSQVKSWRCYYAKMDFDDMRAFVSVADTGSLSQATRELYVTQPAVTRRLRRLESSLGTKLLNRRVPTVCFSIDLPVVCGRAELKDPAREGHNDDSRRFLPRPHGRKIFRLLCGRTTHLEGRYNRLDFQEGADIRIQKLGCRRSWLVACGASLLFFSIASIAHPQTTSPAFRVRTQIPARMGVGQPYRIHLEAAGGQPPLQWRVSKGKLPPGLVLNTRLGEIAGSPTTVGQFSFTLEVADRSLPPQVAQQDFVVQVIAALTIVWKDGPQVQGSEIKGRVAVSNYTGDAFDLTVIIVAVNEIGRATALGYQHFELASGLMDFEIPFGSTLPTGKYVVHADAVAEVPSRKAIYRARQQTPQRLAVTQP